ncbi:hypothetical protein POJ06DRAFT_294296 [Lipomyces tetrasporus]|uniref:Zn(2)-C6 fungal-type domain-containing protein n=1 Tax=Lipomyces tetrasporus TaxID=54092 RepID=A0AAD7VV39_9ASCO|nr:uncharacterized protein POJ06DRAFT_294296 [Lipomyces tetrasporus]KAJ8103103.1 hypothetical protein POJ06DRAFT_294296 [Lipomyces tetrasporus]
MSSTGTRDRTCDQCSFRKVKCDRQYPCGKCQSHSFVCSYDKPRRKKGPTGKRIGLIRSEANTQPLQQLVPVTPPTESPSPEDSLGPAFFTSDPRAPLSLICPQPPPDPVFNVSSFSVSSYLPVGFLSPSAQSIHSDLSLLQSPASTAAWPTLATDEEIKSLIDTYFSRIEKFLPVINKSTFLARLHAHEHTRNIHFGALVLTMCAFTLLQPITKQDSSESNDKRIFKERIQTAQSMMSAAVSMRDSDAMFAENPTLDSVLMSFFLFSCFFNCQMHHAAWFRLQEAVTLAEIMGLQGKRDGWKENLTDEEREQRTRVYWVLAVTERAYALQRHHSLIRTSPSPNKPASLLAPNLFFTLSATGLDTMVELYKVVDADLIDCWNGRCATADGACTKLSAERAASMHRLVADAYDHDSVDHDRALNETQRADLAISQQWLHNRLWQLCLSHGVLVIDPTTSTDHRELRLTYACDIARKTMGICRSLSMESMEVHGIGIMEKLYDIASSVVGLMSCFPWIEGQRNRELVPSDREILNQYIALLATFRGGQHPYLLPLMTEITSLPPVGA